MKERIKAELWDKTQYILSKFYDRMMHYAVYMDGDLDLDLIRKSIDKVIKNVKVLRSRYVPNPIRQYWLVTEKYSIEELATKEEIDDLNGSVEEFLKIHISHKSRFQFRAKIFTCKDKCAFALVVNHQCFDGSELKYTVRKIVECYNAFKTNGNADSVEIKNGSRAIKQLYEKMAPSTKAKAKKLYNNASKTGVKSHFRFTQNKEVSKIFFTRVLDIDFVNKLKEKGKKYNATLNDVILAAYFRAYAKEAGFDNNKLLNITSIVDLRRHLLSGNDLEGCTNMVAFMPCKLNGIGENFIETLRKVAENNNNQKKDEVVGLYGIPLLALAYKIIWFDIVSGIAVKIGYENPVMQMSNLGKIDRGDVTFYGCKMTDILCTGAVKNRPYFQLTCVSIDTHLNICIAENCSKEDEVLINSFLDDIIEILKEFIE